MRFIEAVEEQARRFDKVTSDAKFVSLAKSSVNLAYLDVGKSWNWPHLETYGSILAVPIAKGSVTVTNGSRTVTITGADSDWEGRFFRKDGGENNYLILDVTGNILTLEQPIAEDTGAIDYEIEKRFYRLPPEAREIIAFDAHQDRVMSLDNRGLRSRVINYRTPLLDVPFHVHGTGKFETEYSTGKASNSGTDDSPTAVVTFTGGAELLDNAMPGDIFVRSKTEYRIKRIETDTRIMLYNLISDGFTGEDYKIVKDKALSIRLRGTFDKNLVLPFNYIRTVYPMIHDDDRIELSEEAKIAVLAFSEAHLAKSLGKDDWANRLLEAQARLRAVQENAVPVRSAFRNLVPLIPSGLGRE